MEKIKLTGSDQLYEIQSIRPTSEHVLQIIFADAVPDSWDGDIQLYTAGAVLATTLTGWNTVYRDEGQTVYLSDDGSVYTPPTDPEPVTPPEPYVPTLAELQEVSRACEQAIYSGVSVTLADSSTEHFALTEHDQLNLFGKQAQLAAGIEQLEYHSDGRPCRYYSAADMKNIVEKAMWHVSYHTTYCNALNMWIVGCESAEEVQQIFYGADVPEQYQTEVLKAYLVKIAAMAGDDVKDAQTA
jgi:hypothetical protein